MLEKELMSIVKELHQGVKNIAPDVMAAFGRAIFIKCLVPMLLTLVLVVLIWAFFPKFYKTIRAMWDREQKIDRYHEHVGPILFSILYGVALVTFTIVFLETWGDSSNWLGLLDQKAYLANLILDRM